MIRSSFGMGKNTFSSLPFNSFGALPPSWIKRSITLLTSTSGAEAPAVTPTLRILVNQSDCIWLALSIKYAIKTKHIINTVNIRKKEKIVPEGSFFIKLLKCLIAFLNESLIGDIWEILLFMWLESHLDEEFRIEILKNIIENIKVNIHSFCV